MNTEYRFLYNELFGFTADSLNELKTAIKDLSFQRRGTLGRVQQRVVDGTLGTAWSDCTCCFKINVPTMFIGRHADTIYCIDGQVVCGYTESVNYVYDMLKCSISEASSLVLSI